MNHPYPHFYKALLDLAPDNKSRAKVLGVSVRSIAYYIDGKKLPRVEVVKRIEALDVALTNDLRSHKTD